MYRVLGNGTEVDEDRLLKVVMLEALEIGSKIKWVQNLKQSLEMFGWGKSDVYSLEKGKGWMEERGTEAP